MSQQTTLILFPQTTYNGGGTANVYSLTSNAQPAAAYYLGNQDLQTINIKTSNFTGNIVIEATLSSNAQTNEYFEVYKSSNNANANLSMYTNIDGNFVYMRAKIEDFQFGVVNFVKLSY
jgi:hypothetical protein